MQPFPSEASWVPAFTSRVLCHPGFNLEKMSYWVHRVLGALWTGRCLPGEEEGPSMGSLVVGSQL